MSLTNHGPAALFAAMLLPLLAACGKTASPDAPGGGDPVNPGGPYVMLFPDGPYHGLPSGYPLSTLIALDLSDHAKTYPWPDRTFSRMAFEVAPNVFTAEERSTGCEEDSVAFFSTQVLPPGQPAQVDFVDVSMTTGVGPGPWPTSPEHDPSRPAGLPEPNQMCFGVRPPGGAWIWSLEPQTSTWDATTQRFRIRFAMSGATIDAFKIMFRTTGGFPRSIVEIAITATPVAP